MINSFGLKQHDKKVVFKNIFACKLKACTLKGSRVFFQIKKTEKRIYIQNTNLKNVH